MRSERSSRLPVFLVVVSLLCAMVTPILATRELRELDERLLELQGLQTLVADLQFALATMAASARGYALTGDDAYLAEHEEARTRAVRKARALGARGGWLGPEFQQAETSIARKAEALDRTVLEIWSGPNARETFTAQLPGLQERREAVLEMTRELERLLEASVRAVTEERRRTELDAVLLELPFLALALLATLAVARLARQQRELAARIQQRAREQAALREAAHSMSGLPSFQQVAKVAADHAVATTRAIGAYVERADVPKPGTEIEVVAVSGKGPPPLGNRVPYTGSLTESLIASGGAQLVTEVGAIGERMAPYLSETCRGCSGLVVPLCVERKIVGALVLLRGPEEKHFSADECAHARALGDIASASLGRVLLVEELSESESRFRQIAEHLRQAIWLGDPHRTQRLYANPAWEKIYGMRREEFYRNPSAPLEVVHPDDREKVDEASAGLVQYDLRYRIVRPDGELRWLWSRAYPVYNARGEVYRVVGLVEDITEQQRAEVEREWLLRSERAAHAQTERARIEAERQRERLARVTRSRSMLIRGVGHDLKNPLGAASGFLRLLERDEVEPLTPRQRQRVARVRRTIGAALKLVGDMLELARAEANELQLETAPVDLRTSIAAVAEDFRGQIEEKGLELVIELPEDLPVVETDASRVRQILGNLVSNATKYTESGRITVGARADAPDSAAARRWLSVYVGDTGHGIPPEHLEAIFDEFRRVSPDAAPGVGIGLAISRRIAQALGGELDVWSEVGVGSTFTLRIPITGVADRPAEPHVEGGESPGADPD